MRAGWDFVAVGKRLVAPHLVAGRDVGHHIGVLTDAIPGLSFRWGVHVNAGGSGKKDAADAHPGDRGTCRRRAHQYLQMAVGQPQPAAAPGKARAAHPDATLNERGVVRPAHAWLAHGHELNLLAAAVTTQRVAYSAVERASKTVERKRRWPGGFAGGGQRAARGGQAAGRVFTPGVCQAQFLGPFDCCIHSREDGQGPTARVPCKFGWQQGGCSSAGATWQQ